MLIGIIDKTIADSFLSVPTHIYYTEKRIEKQRHHSPLGKGRPYMVQEDYTGETTSRDTRISYTAQKETAPAGLSARGKRH